jgi:hypothetical protein
MEIALACLVRYILDRHAIFQVWQFRFYTNTKAQGELVLLGHIIKIIWWSSPPVPENRARPNPIFNFFNFQKSFFLAFFHILMQSEKYILENTFLFVVHLN